MITLTAKISLLDSDAKIVDYAEDFKDYKNNISTSYIPKNTKVKGSNPFILGSSKLGNSNFSGNVDYAISKQLSDEDGNFNPTIELSILSDTKIESFSIAFDTLNNRHPKSIKVTGMGEYYYYDDDPIFVIKYPKHNVFNIFIDNWNTPNSPLVITGIYLDIEIEINNRNLISLGGSIFERGDTKLPSYGIISNTGNLEFNDLDGEIKDYAEQLLLQSGLQVLIQLKDTLSNKVELVAKMETAQWDYDNNNRSVSVSLKDDLEEWQDIQVQGFYCDPKNPYSVIVGGNMANYYNWLMVRTPDKYKMRQFDRLDSKTKDILQRSSIDYPLLKDGSLWEQWQKLCEVCGLYIYKNNEGETVCTYTYGS